MSDNQRASSESPVCRPCGRRVHVHKGRFNDHPFHRLTDRLFVRFASRGVALPRCPGSGQAPKTGLEAFGVVV